MYRAEYGAARHLRLTPILYLIMICTSFALLVRLTPLVVYTFPVRDLCDWTLNIQLHHPPTIPDDSLVHDSYSTFKEIRPVLTLIRPNREGKCGRSDTCIHAGRRNISFSSILCILAWSE